MNLKLNLTTHLSLKNKNKKEKHYLLLSQILLINIRFVLAFLSFGMSTCRFFKSHSDSTRGCLTSSGTTVTSYSYRRIASQRHATANQRPPQAASSLTLVRLTAPTDVKY